MLGGTKEDSVSPTRESLIYPPGKSMIFTKNRKHSKIEFVARPVAALLVVPVLGAGAGLVLGAAVTALALLLAVVFVAT